MKGLGGRPALLVGLGLALLGCRRPAKVTAPFTGTSFIALERDFADFNDWEVIELSDGGVQGLVHMAGPRKVFINRRPDPGARTFPVGTMIVKEIVGAPVGHDLFAMVKRGGGYNQNGAPGWEWFELRRRQSGSYAIAWRGFNPPPDEGYAADVTGGCNGCHNVARNVDFVQTPKLSLGK